MSQESSLKKRLVAVLTVKNGIVVQSIGFEKYLPVGKPEIAVEFLNQWGIDEIVLLDLDASKRGGPDLALIARVAKNCFVPLTVGGGLDTVEKMRNVVLHGADKVTLNTAIINNPNLVREAAAVLGDQCIIVSIDVKGGQVYSHFSKRSLTLDPVLFAKELAGLGAGEILINSVDRDGCKQGYDLELIRKVSEAVRIPVIACGGVGKAEHIAAALETKASAFAAGNFFHFTEHSVVVVKSFLNRSESNFRFDTQAKYIGFDFDTQGRVNKKEDEYLEKIRFEYEREEEI